MSLRTRFDSALAVTRALSLLAVEKLETGIAFNPMRRDFSSNPYPLYTELRRRDPIHRCRNALGWVVSRYEDVLAVLRDGSYSSDERNLPRSERIYARLARAGLRDPYSDDRGSMLRLDPPTHTRLRSLVAKAFVPRAVDRMRPRIEGILKELLDARPERGAIELVTELAAPLPVRVIAELLGVPPEDHERFRAWSNAVVSSLGDSALEDRRASQRASQELQSYFEEIIAERRSAPRDDLITALASVEEHGERLKRNELYSILELLLVAGNETTTNLIATATLALLQNPEQLEYLRRAPEKVPDAIEELLRYDSPVQLTSRIATHEHEFRGHPIRRGDHLVLLLAGANRDPDAFPEPDRLDLTRADVRHLSFGHGIHFCLGAQLARLEAGLALQALLERFQRLRLSSREVRWRSNPTLRGPEALWLEL